MQPIDFIELLAVVSSACFGILLAARSGMDLTGIFAVAFAAAFGGGTLRDLFLARQPLFWMESPHYPVIVFFLCLLSVILPRVVIRLEPHLVVPDSIGAGSFTMAGAAIAIDSGTTLFLSALFGVMTGTFGAVIAEIICNRLPATFRPGSPLNITCCFVGAWIFLLAYQWGMPRPGAMVVGFLVVTVFRFLAVRNYWTLGPLNRFSQEFIIESNDEDR
ncbi:trimeric intracellular cation channel family protein [Roseibacillus ishigakijimensis]|nr:TRIC cation channel family protein [Roseibacillus ishigakijimensis]